MLRRRCVNCGDIVVRRLHRPAGSARTASPPPARDTRTRVSPLQPSSIIVKASCSHQSLSQRRLELGFGYSGLQSTHRLSAAGNSAGACSVPVPLPRSSTRRRRPRWIHGPDRETTTCAEPGPRRQRTRLAGVDRLRLNPAVPSSRSRRHGAAERGRPVSLEWWTATSCGLVRRRRQRRLGQHAGEIS